MKQRHYLTLDPLCKKLSYSNATDIAKTLKLFLTPKEQQELAIRWEILRRVWRGQRYHKIARELGISTATVSRWVLREWELRIRRINN